MKVKNDLFVGGDTEFRDTAGDVYFKALGGVLNADTLSVFIGDVDGVGSGGLLEVDVINSRLSWNYDLRLSGYISSATARIDNTVNYALGVDATGNVKMIEKSTLGGSSGTIDDVLGNGATATNKTLTMSGSGGITTSGATGITITGTGGFTQQNGAFEFYDGDAGGFRLYDEDDVPTFTSTGSLSGNTLLHDFAAGKLKLSSYGGEAITGTAGSLLALDTSGNVIEESIPKSFSSSKINSFSILPTTSSQSITADVGTMYIVNLPSTSGLSFTMPSSATAGDEIWIGGNGSFVAHANKFSVSGKLFDTGSSIFTFGGDNSSPDYRFGGKDCIKWIWTGTYWFETTHKIQ